MPGKRLRTSSTARQTNSRKRRLATTIAVLVVIVAVVAGFAVKWSGSSHGSANSGKTVTAHNRDIGAGVTVSGEKVPSDMRAQLAKQPIEPKLEPTTALTKTLEIGPSGKLAAPTTVTLTLDREVATNDTVVVATNPTHTKGGWETVSAGINADRKHVTFVVDHLSWFKALLVDVKDGAGMLKREFVDGMAAGVFTQAQKPVCTGESDARKDDYVISSSAKDTLYWCIGKEGGKRVLKVVNHRRYPVELKTNNLTVNSTGNSSLDFAVLFGHFGHRTIVMPGEEADMSVNSLKAGSKATVDSNLSNLAMGLHTVDVIGTAVAQLTLKIDPSALKNSRELVNDVLSMKGCVDVLGDMNVGHFLSGCFDAHTLSKFLNWRAAILAPVVTAFSAIGLTQSWLNLVGDSKNGRAQYNVTVTKRDTSVLASFVGTWYRGDQDITIKPDGTVVWHAFYGGIGDCVSKWMDHSNECWKTAYGAATPEGDHVILKITNHFFFWEPTGSTDVMRKAGPGMVTTLTTWSSNPDADTDDEIHYCSAKPRPGTTSPCKNPNV